MPSDPTEHKRFHRQHGRATAAGRAKRAHKRLRRIPTLWARIAVLGVFAVTVTALIIHIALQAIYPYRQSSMEAATLAGTRARIAALQASDDTLRRRIAYLKTPQGIAAEAHPLGYVRPGERILVMPGFPATEASGSAAPVNLSWEPATPDRQSLAARFWSHLQDF